MEEDLRSSVKSGSPAGADEPEKPENPAPDIDLRYVKDHSCGSGESAVSAGETRYKEGPGTAWNFDELIDNAFSLPEKDWEQYSPLTLAWLGDTVFEVIVRTVLTKRGNRPTYKLQRMSADIVNARTQAEYMSRIRDRLTEKEMSVYKRGRNSSPAHKAKNANRAQYLEATGFECLIGYLYLERQYARIAELTKDIFQKGN